jgi:hypothetical protein
VCKIEKSKKIKRNHDGSSSSSSSFTLYPESGLPDFYWYNIPKRGKCTKCVQNHPMPSM